MTALCVRNQAMTRKTVGSRIKKMGKERVSGVAATNI